MLLIKTYHYYKKNGFVQTIKKCKNYIKKAIIKQQKSKLFLKDLISVDKIILKQQESYRFQEDIKISILVPLYNTPKKFLIEMLESVLNQSYYNWELCLVDGSDQSHSNVEKIVSEFVKGDKRIKYLKLDNNFGIAENTNKCFEMASGDYIGLFDHDDLLHPSALFYVMECICNKNAEFIYTDEATFLDKDKRISFINFKPDFGIDTLRSCNYICHFTVFDAHLVGNTDKLFDSRFNGSQDHDLFLRLTEKATRIEHIPRVLYFWRAHKESTALATDTKSYAAIAGIKAVEESLKRSDLKGEVKSVFPNLTIYRVKYDIVDYDKISIIIPTKNHAYDLRKCVDSIVSLTTYPNYEILIIDNMSTDRDVFDYYEVLEKYSRIKILFYDKEFNYSKINNFAVKNAQGKYYILLNNDTKIISPNWIEEMLMFAQRGDVGAVGAKLYYEDNTIQHAGVVLGLEQEGLCKHSFYEWPKESLGYSGRLIFSQEYSAVTAACIMIRSDVFNEVGGFDEIFKVAYNDIDLCLRIRKHGYLVVWTPFAELYHYECKTRGKNDNKEKMELFLREKELFKMRWLGFLKKGDPYYNPNLDEQLNFTIKGRNIN